MDIAGYHIILYLRKMKSKTYNVGIENVLIAQYTDLENVTGATILIFPESAKGVALTVGGAPSTRNFDSLMLNTNSHPIYAFLITGGSSFGLSSTDGVVEYLRETGRGIRIDNLTIPIVPTCVIFDLFIGNPIWPSSEEVYRACKEAGKVIEIGSVGAGTGAIVGKLFGAKRGTKGGLGYVEKEIGEVRVGVLSVVNAFGDIKEKGEIIAGTLDENKKLIGTSKMMERGIVREIRDLGIKNTTIVVVLTEVELTKREAYRVGQMALAGMAEVIDPVWTPYDGDIVVVLSTGNKESNPVILGTVARSLVTESILIAVKEAVSLGGIPAFRDLRDT